MLRTDSFLAVYGSLRRRSLAKLSFFVLRDLEFYGYGILRGLLLIQNGYPAVLEQSGEVGVEIFRLEGKAILEELDRYEGYRLALGPRSLFYRKEVDLRRPEIRAWVYFLGREIPRGRRPVVRSAAGAWRQPGSQCYLGRQQGSVGILSAGRVARRFGNRPEACAVFGASVR
jgi:gamma-glutamylcyclotransferase (GGCT)/AIG2-like uncharacterized protein YtfP